MEIIKGEDLKWMKFIKQSDGTLKVYEETNGRYKPNIGDIYYCLNVCGDIDSSTNDGTKVDAYVISHNLIFETEKECEDYKLFLDQLDEYKHNFTLDEWIKSESYKYNLFFDTRTKKVEILHDYSLKNSGYYFKTEEDAKNFIEVATEERIKKYMFDVWE